MWHAVPDRNTGFARTPFLVQSTSRHEALLWQIRCRLILLPYDEKVREGNQHGGKSCRPFNACHKLERLQVRRARHYSERFICMSSPRLEHGHTNDYSAMPNGSLRSSTVGTLRITYLYSSTPVLPRVQYSNPDFPKCMYVRTCVSVLGSLFVRR